MTEEATRPTSRSRARPEAADAAERAPRWPRQARSVRLHGGQHPGPRGSRGRPQAPGHVHRLDRRARPASPRLGGRRQLDRRGDGRPGHDDRRHDQAATASSSSRTTVAASRSASTRPARTPSRSSTRSSTPAASSAAAATRCRAACTASASASSTRSPSGCASNRRATGSSGRRSTSRGKPTGPVKKIGPQGTRRGTTTSFLADPEMFETTEYSFEIISQRLRESAYLNEEGLDHAHRRAERPRALVLLRGRAPVVRPAPQPEQGGPPHPADLRRAARGRHGRRGRAPVQRLVHRERPGLRQQHQHARRRHPRHRLPRGAHELAQRLGAPGGRAQGRRRQPVRRRRPRGPDRGHQRQADRSPVRGPDEGQARQRRGQGPGPDGGRRQPRPVPRREPRPTAGGSSRSA